MTCVTGDANNGIRFSCQLLLLPLATYQFSEALLHCVGSWYLTRGNAERCAFERRASNLGATMFVSSAAFDIGCLPLFCEHNCCLRCVDGQCLLHCCAEVAELLCQMYESTEVLSETTFWITCICVRLLALFVVPAYVLSFSTRCAAMHCLQLYASVGQVFKHLHA